MALGKAPIVRLLPILGIAAWAGAVVLAGRTLDPWGPFGGPYEAFGAAAPAWLPWTLAGIGAIGVVIAAWAEGWALPYLPAAAAIVLGAGARLVADPVRMLDIALFAGLVLLSTELLSAKARFDAVVASSTGLGKSERAPVTQFLARYLVGVLLLCAAYAALAWVLAMRIVPAVAGLASTRLADGIELRSSVGLLLFSGALLGLAVLARMLVDALRPAPPPPVAAADIRELRPLTREDRA